MNDALEKEEEKAFKEYQDALDKLHQLLDSRRKSSPSGKIVFKQWDSVSELEQYLKKLEKSEERIAEARKKWDETLRRMFDAKR